MYHKFLEYSEIKRECVYPFERKKNIHYSPNIKDFKKVHLTIYKDYKDFSWKIRTLPSKAWKILFIPAWDIHLYLQKTFESFDGSLSSILCITINLLSVIHPFFDGNRRCICSYTNYILHHNGYKQIDWHKLRPVWEKNIFIATDEFIKIILWELKKESYWIE